jgi:hypothetical protein
MTGVFDLWYGWSLTCIGCGDSYTSETGVHRLPRPFSSTWKRDAITHALKMWPRAVPLAQEEGRQLALLAKQMECEDMASLEATHARAREALEAFRGFAPEQLWADEANAWTALQARRAARDIETSQPPIKGEFS